MKRSLGILGFALLLVVALSPPVGAQSGLGNTFDNTIPQITPSASSSVAGIVELSTDAEAIAGSDTTRALTPANLAATTVPATHTYYVDSLRTETYTADGSTMRPYKTLLAALTAVNADSVVHTAAGHYELTQYIVRVAPGTYSDNLVINNQKYLRLELDGAKITGSLTLTTTQQSGDYYSKIEFVGGPTPRPYRGHGAEITGDISGTRNNDSLIYVSFNGISITGDMGFSGDGTWVVYLGNCYFGALDANGNPTNTTPPYIHGSGFTDPDSTVLLETFQTQIKGHIAAHGDDATATTVELYDVNQTRFDLINITPKNAMRVLNSRFDTNVTITAQTLNIDAVSYKSLMATTENLTGCTIAMLEDSSADWEIVTAGGTVDAITADYAINKTLTDLKVALFRSSGANTSTTPSFAPDGLTAHTIVKSGGQALVAGDIGAAGMICILQYDLANTRWELTNPVYPLGYADKIGLSGTMTDEQLLCGENTDGTTKAKSCGAKTVNNATASHGIYIDADGHVENIVTVIDAHAASTTITLIPGICPVIHNAAQGDEDVSNALPALAEGLCFVLMGRTTPTGGDNYNRLTAASANTINLDKTTTGKDYIQLTNIAVDDYVTCMASGTDHWACYTGVGTAAAGDL